jgi:hypothetical protein
MEKTFESRTLSIRIDRDAQDVYDFVSVPENWPKWATGLGTLKKGVHGSWIAETPQGQVKVRFTKQNDFGVLDHYVTPEGGAEIYIPQDILQLRALEEGPSPSPLNFPSHQGRGALEKGFFR